MSVKFVIFLVTELIIPMFCAFAIKRLTEEILFFFVKILHILLCFRILWLFPKTTRIQVSGVVHDARGFCA